MKKGFCVFLLIIGMVSPAAATGTLCGPKQAVGDQLAQRYGEVPIVSGISLNNSMKFYGNPKTGSWSMVFIKPDGVACVLASGEALEVSSLAYAQMTATPAFAAE